MMDDYHKTRGDIAGKREEELKAKRARAKVKMDEEKAKRRATVLKQRDDERKAREEEERLQRQKEEEEEALREEEERARAAEEEKKRAEEEARIAKRKAREDERARDLEEARKRAELEEAALLRRAQSKPEGPGVRRPSSKVTAQSGQAAPPNAAVTTPPSSSPRTTSPPPRAGVSTPRAGTYRPPGARGADIVVPATPVRAQSPVRSSPAPGPPSTVAPKPGGWRERQAAKERENALPGDTAAPNGKHPEPASSSPKPPQDTDEQGSKTTQPKWKPPHLRDK